MQFNFKTFAFHYYWAPNVLCLTKKCSRLACYYYGDGPLNQNQLMIDQQIICSSTVLPNCGLA